MTPQGSFSTIFMENLKTELRIQVFFFGASYIQLLNLIIFTNITVFGFRHSKSMVDVANCTI